MQFEHQKSTLDKLHIYARSNIHALIVSGGIGWGRTYMAMQYAKMLDIDDCICVSANKSELLDVMATISSRTTPVVLCIQNLDSGVAAASHMLLKCLEEPSECVYIVITCNQVSNILDTILSRCQQVELLHPLESDLKRFIDTKYPNRYSELVKLKLWQAVKSYSDIDMLCQLSSDKLNYIATLPSHLQFVPGSVSEVSWKITRFPDKTDTPIVYIMQLLLCRLPHSKLLYNAVNDCVTTITCGNIGAMAAIQNFSINMCYGGVASGR